LHFTGKAVQYFLLHTATGPIHFKTALNCFT